MHNVTNIHKILTTVYKRAAMRMNTTTTTSTTSTTPIISSKFISRKEEKEMLAFVFCLHAHLKRFLPIITSIVSHMEKVYKIYTEREGGRD